MPSCVRYMNSIRRHVHATLGALLLAATALTAYCLYFDVALPVPKRALASATYVCPMHSDVQGKTASDCPKCGMKLVAANAAPKGHEACRNEHPACCADKAKAAASMELPPGHPPVAGYTVSKSAA